MPTYTCLFHEAASVGRYDRLRHIPHHTLDACARAALAGVGRGGRPVRLLDAGAGTGRFLTPIANACRHDRAAAHLVALDLSRAMLHALQQQTSGYAPPDRVTVTAIQADLQDPLPFGPGTFDVVLTAATFHILARWRDAADGMIEALTLGGRLVVIAESNQFMHQTEGFSRDADLDRLDPVLSAFMQHYHWLRNAYGHPYQPSEVRYSDMSALLEHVQERGLRPLAVPASQAALRWGKTHCYADILHCFRHRQMTTWGSELPEPVRQRIADALEAWVAAHGIDPTEEFHLPAELVPHVFLKPGRHPHEVSCGS